MKSLGYNAFHNCSNVTQIVVSEENATYNSGNGSDVIIHDDDLIRGCYTTKIPEGVNRILEYAFSGCDKLTSITLPKNLYELKRPFVGCINLRKVSCLSKYTVAYSTSSGSAFDDIPLSSARLYVPNEDYKTRENWKDFGTIIVTHFELASSVKLDKKTAKAKVGDKCQLSVEVQPSEALQSMDWRYSNPSVASVDDDGMVTAVGIGTATVTATTIDGTYLSAACEVTVTDGSTIYVDMDVTAQFPTDWQGWIGATGYTSTQYAPMVTTNDGRNVQVCERFNKNSATTGTVFYRTLTGLTNGIYRIELYGAAASTKGRDTAIDSDMTADDEGDETAVFLYATTPSGTVSQYIPVHWATSFLEVATAVLNNVKVTDGTVEIGMYSEKKYTNWHVVQIKGVTALVDAEERHVDVLQTAQADLASETYANIVGEEQMALKQAVSQYATVSERTAEAYKTAIDAIVAASSTFEKALPSYEIWVDIVRRSYPYASVEKKAAAESAAAQLPTTAPDAESKRETLIPLYRTYAESSALLEGVEGSENVTDLYIENPRAGTGYSATGWQVTWGEGSPVGSIGIKTAEPWTDADGSTDHRYFDGGYWGAQSWDATQQQEVTLPAGHYQLTVIGRSSSDVEQTLFAGENSIEMPHIGAAGGLFNRGWEQTSLEFEIEDESTIGIGVRGVTSVRQNWMSFSDFRLIKFPNSVTRVNAVQTDKVFDVYAVTGMKVRYQTSTLDGLPKGIYVVNGRKVTVK